MALLRDYAPVRSGDLEVVQRSVAEALCPHRLDVTRGGGKVDAWFRHRRFRRTSVSDVSYGVPVGIQIRVCPSYFFVIRLAGKCQYVRQRKAIPLRHDRGGVISRGDEVCLQMSSDATILIPRIRCCAHSKTA